MLEITIQQPQVLQAGFTAFVIGSLIVTALVAAFSIHLQLKNQDNLKPEAGDIQITLAEEGRVITWVEGRRKISGTIVDNNPSRTVEIKQKGGGKGLGGGGGGATSGFKYFMDVWQAICRVAPLGLGHAVLIETYVSQSPQDVEASDVVFNDGANGLFPAFFATGGPKPGICHIAYEQMFLGENVNSIPNIQFIVEKVSTGPTLNPNLANGTNPAASVYDLLIECGTKSNEINLGSFNTAAAFWAAAGYGINLSFASKIKGKDAINTLLNYVDGIMFRNRDGLFTIKALDKNDSSVLTITDRDTKNFAINRKSWKQVPNKFKATFIDEDKNYTKRVVVMSNPAAILIAGREINGTIDLTAFRDLTTAAKRLTEIAKRQSYTVATYKFKTFLKYSVLQPADVFTIDFDRTYNGQQLKFIQKVRLQKITIPDKDGIEVEIEAVELIEDAHDDAFLIQGGSDAVQTDFAPIELTNTKIFELPYNPVTLDVPAYLIFANREKGFETGYDVHVSNDGAMDFEAVQNFSTFSMHGTLVEAYPDDTFKIDDITGIVFTPTNLNDTFTTVSRERLFAYDRLVCIGDELLAFEQVITLGGGDIQLLGVVRGVYNTPIQSHSASAEIFLTNVSSNILDRGVTLSDFFVKIVPKFLGNQATIGLITAQNVVAVAKAKQSRNVGRLIAVRVGSNITLEIVPSTAGIQGAGDVFTSETDEAKPHAFVGVFLLSYNAVVDTPISVDTVVIVEAAAVTITVKHKINNHISSGIAILVSAPDDTYYA